MLYSIGKVASMTGITISALRYYDREGLFPNMERTTGKVRVFSDAEIEILQMIECLKTSGLSIKEIKQFLDWCQEGDSSIKQRRDLFYGRLDAVKKQMDELQKTMNLIKFKCWYYDTALAAGTEDAPKSICPEDRPAEIKDLQIS